MIPLNPIAPRQSTCLSRRKSNISPFPKDNCCATLDDSLETPSSPQTDDSYAASPTDYDKPEDTSRLGTPELPEIIQRAGDDSEVNVRPWGNVDYLSHDWQEEDIWSSWKYVTSRRGEYPNSARLENAAWRTWAKRKNSLKTLPPETLNWLKDDDVDWLYGPLQPGGSKIYCTQTESSSVSLSKPNSVVNISKKPILKKRSVSDTMLQGPASSSLILQQGAAVVQEQEGDGWRVTKSTFDRAAMADYIMFPFSSGRISRGTSSVLPTPTSSGISSTGVERKHIHFNDEVEQCVAVEAMDGDDDIDTDQLGDSDSDDGLMMKLARPRKRAPLIRKKLKKGKNSLPSDGKTISMLPPTMLKHQEDMLEAPETAIKHNTDTFCSPIVPLSSSQEALHPSKILTRFFGEDEAEDMMDADVNSGWYGSQSFEDLNLHRRTSADSLTAEPVGMRRTPSGMFMPYEEEQPSSNDGIFGRVIDTVNTVRDIAYVLWNVG
ncbi:hypothetical protein B0J13DRAFT_458800 [Dactylonectria estremocensis]|uniref:Nitrogen regulatory protein areA GATA-like domain-containing protein n=1 Tax=Dactylonectria estremocensis TaxID=1079267 RepID=A0A9P9DFS1_9HYPO|nr:hypothetical protein B0J13DRAFT_458800 [Dactylonectria estremocensis]